MIGSPLWRILNYGLIPAFKYFSTYRLSPKSSNKSSETINFLDFARMIEDADHNSESKSRKAVISMMQSMRSQVASDLGKNKIKSVLEFDSSISRLILLELAIRSNKFKTYIETGTQHGLSAYVAGETSQRYSPGMTITSFDVSHDQYIIKSSGAEYFCLSWPVRRNFMKQTLRHRIEPLLFFHDSDHSYENMFFEFNWAWNQLNAAAIISDDVDSNDAFFDFCESSKVKGYRVMIDDGPAVGFVIRDS